MFFSNGSMIAVQKDPSWDMCMLWISVYHDSDESSRLTTLGTLLVSTADRFTNKDAIKDMLSILIIIIASL